MSNYDEPNDLYDNDNHKYRKKFIISIFPQRLVGTLKTSLFVV
jgi:hypothetical protein